MTTGEQKRRAADEDVQPVDNQEAASRLVILRERRLRRQEEGRDQDYEKARRKQERQAIQQAVLYANVDTSTLNCPGPMKGRFPAVDADS